MAFTDYFSILEVHLTASDDVIKAAYRKLCQRYHPDNMGNEKMLSLVSEAYKVLTDRDQKQRYISSYMEHYGLGTPIGREGWKRSMYDYSIQPLRRIVLEYLFFIKNGAYEEAYDMLSRYNRKHLFKKDFIQWQRLISRIHELREFDCTYSEGGIIDFSDSKYLKGQKYIRFKVKVIERNALLDRTEEDYFTRLLVSEDGEWKVLLSQTHLKPVIKKYRKIVDVHQRHQNPLTAEKRGRDFAYATGYVTRQTFLDNCEYEHLRYSRYDTSFSVIGLKVADKKAVSGVRSVLENNTRILDSITYIKRGWFLILLPETDDKKGEAARRKLMVLVDEDCGKDKIESGRCIMQQYKSIKALLNEVMG